MGAYQIRGGSPLRGVIPIHGAKNSLLPILAATLVTKGECVLHNCPRISDADVALAILRSLGCEARREGQTLIVNTYPACETEIPAVLMQRMRAAVIFLGALLALEIKRELLGDILVAEDYAVVFCHETARELVFRMNKIGSVGVSAELGVTRPIPEVKTKRIEAAVSSLRLDCIVSAAANISRERSASLIKSGQVNADFFPCLNLSREISAGTVISVRGSGRYRLSEISGETKKGRIRVVIEKYI